MHRSHALFIVVAILISFPYAVSANGNPVLKFIENKSQWDCKFHYGADVPGGKMFLESGGFSVFLLDQSKLEELHERSHHAIFEDGSSVAADEKIQSHFLKFTMKGSSLHANITPYHRSDEYFNYFLGNDASRWASKAYAYKGVVYDDVYPGIDMKMYSVNGNFKYDFIVAPESDPGRIELKVEGAQGFLINDEGDLEIRTSIGMVVQDRPYVYQMSEGKKRAVPCQYKVHNNVVSFVFPHGYDDCLELVIDPLLIFSTYSGSTADNWGSTATPGEKETLYSAGVTQEVTSGKYPATPGAFQTDYGGLYDVGILKYDSSGQQLLYASYLGGSGSESPHSLIADAEGNLVVMGTTSSSDFPTSSNAFDQSFGGGHDTTHVVRYNAGSDLFVSKISVDGSLLIGSTYIGGSFNDGLNPNSGPLTRNYGDQLRGDVVFDNDGNIVVSSVTSSDDFPVTTTLVDEFKGETDAVIFKLLPDLTTLVWSSYLGGEGYDASHTIKVDSDNTLFVAGGTTSEDFPVTENRYQSIPGGGADGFIAHLSADGASIINGTFTGTSLYDQIYFLDIDSEQNVYVFGQTLGSMPITPSNVYHNPGGKQFVQKFDRELSSLVFSTVFGSGRLVPDISPTAFMVNDCNNLYLSGWGGITNQWRWGSMTSTTDMQITQGALQASTSGSDFYFMVLTDDATELLYATYLGGTSSRTHVDGGTSRFDKRGIVYHAVCSGCAASNASNGPTSDFPTTPGAWSRFNLSENCNNAAFKLDLASLRARLQTNSLQLDMPGLSSVCIPDPIVFQNRSTGGRTFIWDLGDGLVIEKPDTAAIVHHYEQPGDYFVKLTAIDPGTCQVTDFTTTVVHVYEKQSMTPNDNTICGGSAYVLSASGGTSYEWKDENGNVVSTNASFTIQPEDTTIYYIKIVEPRGCINRDTVQVNVVPAVQPEFEVVRNESCTGRPTVEVRNETIDADDVQFTFDYGDGVTDELMEGNHQYEKDGVYTIKLTGRREFCVYEAKTQMPVYTMKIPNLITPGIADEMNDTFLIELGEDDKLNPREIGMSVSLTVYNRWGKKVFEAGDYQYDWAAQGLSAGVYFYEVTIGGQTCKSWVQVVK